ncbi:MAG: NUDIX hydrolase [Patescibacteria group bacterium]|nr:NUDIX hydrolase [Patescibacteria group bacterium]
MHQIQKNVLRNLLFKEKARFSELNTENVSNDHFSFHVRKLAEKELIEKSQEGFYNLTISGKEYANRLDTDTTEVKIEKQAKISVLIVCIDDSGDKKKYLVQQRLKHPYYGFHGFVSGKIRWGETVYEASARELEEETGLRAKLELAGIEHKIDYSKDGKLLEDKYFYILKTNKLSGELLENFEGGRNLWMTKKEIKETPELFDDVLKVIDVVDGDRFTFFEDKYNVKRY